MSVHPGDTLLVQRPNGSHLELTVYHRDPCHAWARDGHGEPYYVDLLRGSVHALPLVGSIVNRLESRA